MSKHTPGPWKVGLKFPHKNRFVVVSNAEWNERPSDARGLIANIVLGGNSKEVAEANARLIAAAPELLAELEKIASGCEFCEGFGTIEYQPPGIDGYLPTGDANFVVEDCPHCTSILAVIAKAKGE